MVYTILQRLSEVMIAKRNTARLLDRGAVEFGGSHYPYMVMMHTAFFLSMIAEYLATPSKELHLLLLIAFVIAQAVRFWVMRVLGDRWTTRILVIKGETLVARGPYRYLSHPNYVVVAVEILVLPLAFGLWITAI
ncbi:MAG TPA: isoprenylcysteine carboxylmethyltransferase family protein, partial [Candidatus Kapabacteria bacterium]|nr:isoprenylcysteine carboxylmethyltransferase family protein [Candidatus Kapabacteria bacterium]